MAFVCHTFGVEGTPRKRGKGGGGWGGWEEGRGRRRMGGGEGERGSVADITFSHSC